MSQRYYTHDEVVQALRAAANGNQEAWAAKHNVDRSTISAALNGKRPVSETLATVLGFASVKLFVRTDETPREEVRVLRPVEQAAMRAEIERAKRDAKAARQTLEGVNAILRRAAEILAREPIRKHRRKETK